MALKMWADSDWSRRLTRTLRVGRVDDDRGSSQNKLWYLSRLTQYPDRLKARRGPWPRGLTRRGKTLLLSQYEVLELVKYALAGGLLGIADDGDVVLEREMVAALSATVPKTRRKSSGLSP